MAYRDLVKQAATVSGTGAFTLGAAVSGFQTMNAGRAVGDLIEYAFTKGAEWETGVGTLAAGDTLTRAPSASSNAGALVNFTAGTGEIRETVTAASLNGFTSVRNVAFSAAIPLNRVGTTYMAAHTVTGPLTLTAAAGAVQGALVYLRIIADGTNFPNFAAFKEWGGSSGYDNRNGIANQVQFFYDGADLFYTASQVVGAVPVPASASGVTMTGPTGGVNGVASSNFALGVTPVGGTITGTVRITPASDVPGDTLTPAFRDLTSAQPTGTFTLTPSSTGARTISATNNGGLTNPASITYTATASATVPAAPTIGTAVAGDGYIDVAFTRNSNGGSVVLDSTATLSTGQTATGTASPIRVTAPNGTPATATVKDRNAVGLSAASSASNSVTPASSVARFTQLSNVTESGTAPDYVYTAGAGAGTADYLGRGMGPAIPAGINGTVTLRMVSKTQELIWGLTTSSTPVAFGALQYGVWVSGGGSNTGTYQQISAGAPGAASPGMGSAASNGDLHRFTRTGTTITLSVSKDAGSTWTVMHTWTGASTAALYPNLCLNNANVVDKLTVVV